MFEPRTFAQIVAARAERDPRGEVLRDWSGERWSAVKLWDRARSWAAGLAESVAPSDLVATELPAGPEAVALTAAVSMLGAVEVPVTGDLTRDQLERILTRAPTLVGRAPVIETRLRTSGLPRDRVSLVSVDGETPDLTSTHPRARRIAPITRRVDDPAVAITTSGTTGRSKIAVLPVGAPIAQARRVAAAMGYGPGDILLSYFGWNHINARHATVLPALISGARVVFTPHFSASGFLDLVRAERVTAFNFMGAMCMMLLAQPEGDHDHDHRLRAAYGGPAAAPLVAAFRERFGVTLRQAYACTELGDVANTPLDRLRPGSAGPITADYDVRVVGEDGDTLPDGRVGELLVRPCRPGLAVLEYLDAPDQTAAAWRDGWFRTRDRVRLDDGWLWVEGRVGDVIRRRGVNIDPSRIEIALQEHPAVADAAAVGVPSELTEEEVLAVVQLRTGGEATPAELWRFCRDRLPTAMVPRHVVIGGRLPVNQSLKLDRALLRAGGLPRDAWDAELDLTATES